VRPLLALIVAFVAISSAHAHVTVWPRESRTGANEKYTVRVPTEGKVATASIELELPAQTTFLSVAVPAGYTYELKKMNDRVVGIVWTMQIKAGEFAEFEFMARNPKDGKQLVWKAVQRFADGSSTQWVGPAGDKHPASVTNLIAGDAGHSH
jgi:uncharacterized protein YcnI